MISLLPYPQLESFDTLRSAEQGYYGGITAVDKEFARLLKALDDNGMADDTIVVYTSDHGEMMGSHGHMAKQMPHEESCRVPFLRPLAGDEGSRQRVRTLSLPPSTSIRRSAAWRESRFPITAAAGTTPALMRGDGEFHAPEMVFLMNDKGPMTASGSRRSNLSRCSHQNAHLCSATRRTLVLV